MNRVICSVFCIGAAAAVDGSYTLDLVNFDLGSHPQAMCNDGTPSGYYFHSSSTGSKTWIVFQQGGDWCYDEDSCKARLNTPLGSSSSWEETMSASGILNSTDVRLREANLVFAPYCSSDAWVGDAQSQPFPFTFHQLGSRIVEAIFDELVETHGLGASAGHSVLYGGCSAGARGALFNLPHAPEYLTKISPSPIAAFGALLDSAFWIDISPEVPSVIPFVTEVKDVYNLINSSQMLNSVCIEANSGAEWRCMLGQYALPYLATLNIPYFFHSYQYDAFQLPHDWGTGYTGSAAQLQYAELFRSETNQSAYTDLIASPPLNTAGLMPACYKHCNTQSSLWSTLATNGVTLEQATAAWWFGLQSDSSPVDAAVPQFIVEACKGFNCGSDCPAP